MAIEVITPAVSAPVSVEEAKIYARVDFDDDDELIAELISAATEHVEQATGRTTVATTYQLSLDCFPSSCPPHEIALPRLPLLEVLSVKYDDENGVEQTLDPSNFTIDGISQPGWLLPVGGSWPKTFSSINAVRIRFTAGYAPVTSSPADPTGNVPARAKVAIKALFAWHYAQREAAGTQPAFEMPSHLNRLLNGLKVWRI